MMYDAAAAAAGQRAVAPTSGSGGGEATSSGGEEFQVPDGPNDDLLGEVVQVGGWGRACQARPADVTDSVD